MQAHVKLADRFVKKKSAKNGETLTYVVNCIFKYDYLIIFSTFYCTLFTEKPTSKNYEYI